MEKEIIEIIDNLLERIDKYQFRNQDHSFTCNFIKGKYLSAKRDLADLNSAQAKAFFLWNKWFAPRILFEGIADPEILQMIEKLDSILGSKMNIGKLDHE